MIDYVEYNKIYERNVIAQYMQEYIFPFLSMD